MPADPPVEWLFDPVQVLYLRFQTHVHSLVDAPRGETFVGDRRHCFDEGEEVVQLGSFCTRRSNQKLPGDPRWLGQQADIAIATRT